MMIILEEVIKREEETTNMYSWGSGDVEKEQYHRQLVALLKELKAYREAEEEIDRKRKSGQWSDAIVFGMNMAFWIMHNHIREVNVYE